MGRDAPFLNEVGCPRFGDCRCARAYARPKYCDTWGQYPKKPPFTPNLDLGLSPTPKGYWRKKRGLWVFPTPVFIFYPPVYFTPGPPPRRGGDGALAFSLLSLYTHFFIEKKLTER